MVLKLYLVVKFSIFVILIIISSISLLNLNKSQLFKIEIPEYVPASKMIDFNAIDSNIFELGKELFYDPILSKTNKISCSSCHNPNAAFSDTSRFSRGIHSKIGRRNSMSIVNLAWNNRFFWDGRS
jgi:cytochrome c peroxidase